VKISRIEIDNLLGTEHVAFPMGTATVVSGGNGSGKTSILRAVMRFFEGGHDPSIRRRLPTPGRPFAEKGMARLTLDSGATVTMTVTEKRTVYEIVDAHGLAVPETPRQFLEKLGTSMSVDPATVLSIDVSTTPGKRKLIEALLNVMPITFVAGELPALCGATSDVGLAEFDGFQKAIMESRRRVGVEARDSEGTIRDLSQSLPAAGEEADWPTEVIRLESERRERERIESEKLHRLEKDVAAEKAGLEKDADDQRTALRQEFQRQADTATAALDVALSDLEDRLKAAQDEARAAAEPAREQIVGELATAREKAAQHERAEGARQTIGKMQARYREKTLEYERYSRALEQMERVRKTKLEALPVSGLEFDGDNVRVDGVEWPNVNKARLGSIAYQICALRAGDLPFLILDDTEHCDRETWRGVLDAAVSGGFQVLAARVDEEGGALRIRTEEAHPPASGPGRGTEGGAKHDLPIETE